MLVLVWSFPFEIKWYDEMGVVLCILVLYLIPIVHSISKHLENGRICVNSTKGVII